MIVTSVAITKPGNSSYKKLLRDWPSILYGATSQNKTVRAPAAIPASAPARVIRDQNKLNKITGPNAEPKPAHALLTRESIELFRSWANTTASRATVTTELRPTIKRSL